MNNILRMAESDASPGGGREVQTITAGDVGKLDVSKLTAGGVVTTTEGLSDADRAAAMLPNKDCHVPLVDLQFGSTTRPVTYKLKCQKPEFQFPTSDDNTLAVRVNFEAMEEMVSTDEPGQPKPVTKGPGFVFRPFPFTLVGKKGQNDITVRDLNRLLLAAGVVERHADLKAGEVIQKLPAVEGKEVKIKFSLQAGKEKDENGNWKLFQRMSFAAANGADPVAAAGSPVLGNY